MLHRLEIGTIPMQRLAVDNQLRVLVIDYRDVVGAENLKIWRILNLGGFSCARIKIFNQISLETYESNCMAISVLNREHDFHMRQLIQ